MFYFLLCFGSFLLKDSHTLKLAESSAIEAHGEHPHQPLSRRCPILLGLLSILSTPTTAIDKWRYGILLCSVAENIEVASRPRWTLLFIQLYPFKP